MLKPKTKRIIRLLAKKYHLKAVMLFGSLAKNNAQAKSDIDLAVLADPDFYEKRFADFTYDLIIFPKETSRPSLSCMPGIPGR